MSETAASGSADAGVYMRVVAAFTGLPDVSFDAQGKRSFGSAALKVHGKIFAMLDSKGEFVVKLPKARVDALVAEGQGQRFEPGMGRLMKEWLVVTPVSEEIWLSLAQEALGYVRSA